MGTLRVSCRPRRIRPLFVGDEQRFLAVLRLEHAIAFAFQVVTQQRYKGAFVFGNENSGFQHHVLGSNGTFVLEVTSALGRSFARKPPLTMW